MAKAATAWASSVAPPGSCKQETPGQLAAPAVAAVAVAVAEVKIAHLWGAVWVIVAPAEVAAVAAVAAAAVTAEMAAAAAASP